MDKSGRIDLLDKESLEFVETRNAMMGAGRLFNPEEYIGARRYPVKPKDLLDYDVFPIFLKTYFYEGNPEPRQAFFGELPEPEKVAPTRVESKYLGMFVAGLSRNGSGLILSVIDDKGREVIEPKSVKKGQGPRKRGQGPRTVSYSCTGRAVYFSPLSESVFTVGKYLVETIHPPILSLGSFFTAYSFDAVSGHRALFLLPNSFMAIQGRI
jgi:hypothetical protein